MSDQTAVVILRHGTTRMRAEAILMNGPDISFREPGQNTKPERGFSTAPVQGPFPLGSPEFYAARKARLFPNEGGPAVLEMEVPESIARLADDGYSDIRFEYGHGLAELLAIWPTVSKRIL